MKKILIILIKAYKKLISPYLPSSCRFYPTCSSYAVESIERFGIVVGIWLTLKRVMKCHPLHPGGFDPVPENLNFKHSHKH